MPLQEVHDDSLMTNPTQKFDRITFVASDNPEAQAALQRLIKQYGQFNGENPQAVVALGGDGHMLQTLHRYMHRGIPIYGMNRGSVGFLMNEYREDGLLERLDHAETTVTHPLTMTATDDEGRTHRSRAINEVSLFRQTYQAAKLKISVDDKIRLEELICDGVLVATPAGSTAYNLSAYGPILPIDTALLALTPISPFRPRRWRGALLPNRAHIVVEVLEAEKRPVNAVADHTETRSVVRVEIQEDASVDLLMMFDPGHSLDERILSEQFRY